MNGTISRYFNNVRFDGYMVSKFVTDNWLTLLVSVGILILLWCGGEPQVVPASTLGAPETINWFAPIELGW